MNNKNLATIYGRFEDTVASNLNKPAVVYLGTQWSFRQLKKLIDRFAAGLADIGIRENDKVIICLPNIPQWLVAFFAIQRVGATVIPVSIYSTKSEMQDAVSCCEPETIICMDTNFGYAHEMLHDTKVRRIIVATLDDLLPGWKRLINKSMKLSNIGHYPKTDSVFRFRKMLKTNSAPPPWSEGITDRIPLMCFTGGTLNLAKLLSFTDPALIESISHLRSMSEVGVPLGTGIALLGRPLNECFGLTIALSCMVFAGETLLLAPEENVDAFMAMIQRKRVNHILGSPELFRDILQNPRLNEYDLSSLIYAVTGGDSLPRGLADGWKKQFNHTIYPSYILTETCGPVACCPSDTSVPFGSAGKLMPSKRIKFVEPGTLEEVAPDEVGEIMVSSDSMVEAYWNDTEETRKSFISIDGELWFRTGDMGRMDSDGWIYFLNRSTDVIHHAGHKIVAPEIERMLEEHPAVDRAAVVGVPDREHGERIKAFLVLSSGVKGITSSGIIEWCQDKLEPHMIPQHIEFRDMLPTSRSGKLLKRELVIEEAHY